MPQKNSLRKDNTPQKLMEGDTITNMRVNRIVQRQMPDGSTEEIMVSGRFSGLNETGEYIDTELKRVIYDSSGNPMPEDQNSVILSHSGLFIPSPEERAVCSSILHPGNRNRNIFIGHDGHLRNGRAICSHCRSLLFTIYLVLGILGVGTIIGLFKGTGLL